jgi:membrane protein DedA with SNARE-associated domain/membrane-associated phospholipid phosphatase
MKPFWIVVAAAIVIALVLRWRRFSTERRIFGVLAAAAAAVYGAGLVHLPNIEKVIEDVGTALGTWTYALVGVFAFLETGAFVGLVLPGETALLVGGVVAGQGRISIVVVIAIAWAAAVLGDTVSFLLGRRLGRGFLERHGPRFKITEERLTQVEGFFHRHGGPTILIGRFIGLVRALAPFIAGSSKMSYARFLPYDIVGCGLWAAALLLLGYVFWHSFDKALEIAKQGALALGLVIGVVVGIVVAWRRWRQPENREKTRRWLDEQAQRPAVRPVVAALRPVVRALGGPSRFVAGRLTPGGLGLELTSLLAVFAVGAFMFVGLAVEVDHGGTIDFDPKAFDLGHELRTSWLNDVAKVVSDLGSVPVVATVVVAGVAFLAYRRDVIDAVALTAGSLLTYLAVHVAKAAEARARPVGELIDTSGSAFPSGHAAYAIAYVALAVAIARAVPNWAGRTTLVAGAIVLAAAVGLTRVYLRAHFLSDVLAGWSLGATIFAFCGMVALIVAFVRQNEAARA